MLGALVGVLAMGLTLLVTAPSHAVPTDYPPAPGSNSGSGNLQAPRPVESAGILVVDGVSSAVKVKSEPQKAQVRITGDGIDVIISSVGPAGVTLPLGADGSLLIVPGGELVVTGKGFAPTSTMVLWLLSTPTRIGTLKASRAGTVKVSAPIPSGMAPGAHHAQAFGYSAAGQSMRVTVPVHVLARPMEMHRKQIAGTAYFAALDSHVSAEQARALDALIAKMPARARHVRVSVAGYVQPDATSANDMSLSSARAGAVAHYLRTHGVTADFNVAGRGVSSARGQDGRQAQVRIVLTVLG
jgi:outer membrane protein OmpA-like peptidoglycan-associated protein